MKWNTFIDELFKSKLSNTSVPYNPNSWVAMEELLDSELGKTAPISGLKSTLSKVLFMSTKSLAAATVVSVTMAVLPINTSSDLKTIVVQENWVSTQLQLAEIHTQQTEQKSEIEFLELAQNVHENEFIQQGVVLQNNSQPPRQNPPKNGSEANYESIQNNRSYIKNEFFDEQQFAGLSMNLMPLQEAAIRVDDAIKTIETGNRSVNELPAALTKKSLQWNLFAGLNLAKGVGSSLANSINDNGWIAGVEVKLPITNHVNLCSGLNYSIQKNMDIHYSAAQITYGFGKETQITDYQYDELHMASIPVLIEGTFKKHSIALGAFYSRLITTKASINHSTETAMAEVVQQNSGTEYGYTQGFAKNDLGVAASYNYALTSNLSVGSYVNFGTNDITNNEHFGENKIDRAFSANVVLRYGFNW